MTRSRTRNRYPYNRQTRNIKITWTWLREFVVMVSNWFWREYSNLKIKFRYSDDAVTNLQQVPLQRTDQEYQNYSDMVAGLRRNGFKLILAGTFKFKNKVPIFRWRGHCYDVISQIQIRQARGPTKVARWNFLGALDLFFSFILCTQLPHPGFFYCHYFSRVWRPAKIKI